MINTFFQPVEKTAVIFQSDQKSIPFLSQAYNLPLDPSQFDAIIAVLNPSAEESAEEDEKEKLNQCMSKTKITVMEFTSLTRVVLGIYAPPFARVFDVDVIDVSMTKLCTPGTFPPALSLRLVISLDYLYSKLDDNNLIGRCKINCHRMIFLKDLGQIDKAISSARSFISDISNPKNKERLLLSPVYTIVPCLIVVTSFMLEMNLWNESSKAMESLFAFEQIGWVNAITGLRALREAKKSLLDPKGYTDDQIESLSKKTNFSLSLSQNGTDSSNFAIFANPTFTENLSIQPNFELNQFEPSSGYSLNEATYIKSSSDTLTFDYSPPSSSSSPPSSSTISSSPENLNIQATESYEGDSSISMEFKLFPSTSDFTQLSWDQENEEQLTNELEGILKSIS